MKKEVIKKFFEENPKIFQKFYRNYKKGYQYKNGISFQRYVDYVTNHCIIDLFLLAFEWSKTHEDMIYWRDVNKNYEQYVESHYYIS